MEFTKNYENDLKFAKSNCDAVVLRAGDGSGQLIVAPDLQGKVLTSTTDGVSSFGWMNYELIKSGRRNDHINAFGGEDRFWLGPEGGQYSIFFKEGDPFDLDHWQTPEPIDWGGWDYRAHNGSRIELAKAFLLENASAAVFKIIVRRVIEAMDRKNIEAALKISLPAGVDYVGFESSNTVSNAGNAFEKETGLLSIWILGMMQATPKTTVVIPFDSCGDAIEQVINDRYFGKIPADRLKVDAAEGLLFFRGDAKGRGKIGVRPKYARDIMGSWSPDTGALTVVAFSLPKNAAELDYVNSMWEQRQKEPYRGDVVNSYNDGPTDGSQLGQFYELETSSASYELKPGGKQSHVHRTFHFTGQRQQLDRMAKHLFNVGLEEIEKALG